MTAELPSPPKNGQRSNPNDELDGFSRDYPRPLTRRRISEDPYIESIGGIGSTRRNFFGKHAKYLDKLYSKPTARCVPHACWNSYLEIKDLDHIHFDFTWSNKIMFQIKHEKSFVSFTSDFLVNRNKKSTPIFI